MADETANEVTEPVASEVATEPGKEEAPKKTEEEVFYKKEPTEEEEKKVEEPKEKVEEVKETPKEQAPKEVKPEVKIELNLPEGSQLTKEEFEAIKKESVEKGLNLEQTQDLLNKLDVDRKMFLDRKAKELKDQ